MIHTESFHPFTHKRAGNRPQDVHDLESEVDCFHRVLGRHNWDDLEIDEIMPLDHPLLKLAYVITFHELEATIEVRFNPALDVSQTVRHYSPTLSEATINSESISVLELFNHHKERDVSPYYFFV
jgi:hypothetical protein